MIFESYRHMSVRLKINKIMFSFVWRPEVDWSTPWNAKFDSGQGKNFSLPQIVQTDSGVNLISYQIGFLSLSIPTLPQMLLWTAQGKEYLYFYYVFMNVPHKTLHKYFYRSYNFRWYVPCLYFPITTHVFVLMWKKPIVTIIKQLLLLFLFMSPVSYKYKHVRYLLSITHLQQNFILSKLLHKNIRHFSQKDYKDKIRPT